jgi:hypothetical protein
MHPAVMSVEFEAPIDELTVELCSLRLCGSADGGNGVPT